VGNLENLASILGDEGKPVVESVAVEASEPIQSEAPAAEPTGEESATPAEPRQETDDSAKGLQAALIAERRKRQQIEAELQQWRQQQQPQKHDDAAPDPAAFENNPQEYWRQLARYEARQELQAAVQQAQQAQQQQKENERIASVKERLDAAVFTGQQKYRDFDAVINGGLAPFLNDAMREEIAASDVGHEVAYWLGKNPAEAARIASLDARSLAREVVKLETKVTALPKPVLPQTLTNVRDSRGQFASANPYDGPTPLDAVLGRKT